MIRPFRRAFRGAALVSHVTALLLSATPAFADDMAAAEALFKEAKTLFADGKIGEACEKFAESQRLDPSPGTALNLARCHEEQGKTASAWSEYLAAARAARTDGRDILAAEATRRAEELEGHLSRLTIQVEAPVDDLAIERGDTVITAASYGTKLPVDPGTYTLVARAPGYEPWTAEVTVKVGDEVNITVPPLTKLPEAEATPKEPESKVEPKDSDEPVLPATTHKAPIGAYVIAGTGVVVTGVGLVFGALAKGAYNAADEACPTHSGCAQPALDDRSRAGTFATVSTIGVSVGLVGLATGITLWALHGGPEEESEPSAQALSPEIAWHKDGAFFQVRGSF